MPSYTHHPINSKGEEANANPDVRTGRQSSEVASVFEALAREHDSLVDMTEGEVTRKQSPESDDAPVCGTVACHAGWYAYHANRRNVTWQSSRDRRAYTATAPRSNERTSETYNQPVTFTEGAERMAQDLGFGGEEPVRDMLLFLRNNPDIWGNPYGGTMFASRTAFMDEDGIPPRLDLSHLAKHWRGVADRIGTVEVIEDE